MKRLVSTSVFVLLGARQIPVASGHGETAIGGLSQGHALLVMVAGLVLVGGLAALKRADRLTPRQT